MPKKLLFVLLLSSLVVTACQPKTVEEPTEVTQGSSEGVVSLSSEEAMEQALDAVFSSKNGSFAYALTYDGGLMSLVETEDASTPYFEIDGGTSLTMETDWVASATDEAEMAGAPVRVGNYDVYQFMDAEGTCSLDVTLIPYAQEVLRVTLKICEGQDGVLGRDALQQLLGNLVITAK